MNNLEPYAVDAAIGKNVRLAPQTKSLKIQFIGTRLRVNVVGIMKPDYGKSWLPLLFRSALSHFFPDTNRSDSGHPYSNL
jgi:hypothetical protein